MELTNLHIENLVKSIQWLFLQQNLDGSWGKTKLEKIRWTSNAVITLSSLGLSHEERPLEKAVKWLEKYSKKNVEWYLRIPALLECYDLEFVKKLGDISDLEQLLKDGKVGSLPFRVALQLNLIRHGVSFDTIDTTITAIHNTLNGESENLKSFSSSTNLTSLYCEFLLHSGKGEDNLIKECTDWVLLRKIVDNGRATICWENSFGKTAYVMINLIELKKKDIDSLVDINKVLSYFSLNKNGSVPTDSIAAIESKSSVYTTILFLRLISAILKEHPSHYKTAFGKALSIKSIATLKIRKSSIDITKFIIFMIIVSSIFLFLYKVIGLEFIKSLLVPLGAAIVIYTIKKAYEYFKR